MKMNLLAIWYTMMDTEKFAEEYRSLLVQLIQNKTALARELSEILASFYEGRELKGMCLRSGSNYSFTLERTASFHYDKIEWNKPHKTLMFIDDKDHLIFKNLIIPKENELLDLKKHFDIRRNMNIDVLDEFTPIQDIRRSILKWFCLREFTPITGHNFLVTIIKLFNLFVELQEMNESSARG
jgi:hypothetical protein|nr:MAG TPA: hypothetical protein [Caudoviricetes sp.]